MYIITKTDKSGHSTQIVKSSDFKTICACIRGLQSSFAEFSYTVHNTSKADANWPDGLTDSEREMLSI